MNTRERRWNCDSTSNSLLRERQIHFDFVPGVNPWGKTQDEMILEKKV